jgi:hypothetical protein
MHLINSYHEPGHIPYCSIQVSDWVDLVHVQSLRDALRLCWYQRNNVFEGASDPNTTINLLFSSYEGQQRIYELWIDRSSKEAVVGRWAFTDNDMLALPWIVCGSCANGFEDMFPVVVKWANITDFEYGALNQLLRAAQGWSLDQMSIEVDGRTTSYMLRRIQEFNADPNIHAFGEDEAHSNAETDIV